MSIRPRRTQRRRTSTTPWMLILLAVGILGTIGLAARAASANQYQDAMQQASSGGPTEALSDEDWADMMAERYRRNPYTWEYLVAGGLQHKPVTMRCLIKMDSIGSTAAEWSFDLLGLSAEPEPRIVGTGVTCSVPRGTWGDELAAMLADGSLHATAELVFHGAGYSQEVDLVRIRIGEWSPASEQWRGKVFGGDRWVTPEQASGSGTAPNTSK